MFTAQKSLNAKSKFKKREFNHSRTAIKKEREYGDSPSKTIQIGAKCWRASARLWVLAVCVVYSMNSLDTRLAFAQSQVGHVAKIASIERSTKTDEKMNDFVNLLRFKKSGEKSKVRFLSKHWDELTKAGQRDAQVFFALVFGDELDTPKEWLDFLNKDASHIEANLFDYRNQGILFINNSVCANVARNFDSYLKYHHLPFKNGEALNKHQVQTVVRYGVFVDRVFTDLCYEPRASQMDLDFSGYGAIQHINAQLQSLQNHSLERIRELRAQIGQGLDDPEIRKLDIEMRLLPYEASRAAAKSLGQIVLD